MSPMCDSGAETETTSNFFMRCQFSANERQKLCDDVHLKDGSIKNLNEESLTNVLSYGSDTFDDSKKNKYSSIHSVIFKLANVLKDLFLTSASFIQLLSLCFSLICLLKLYLKCNLLSF